MIALTIVGTIGFFWWEYRKRLRHHVALAASRQPLTDEQFLLDMEERGVSRETSTYLKTWLEYAYLASLKPDPNDRIFSDLHVLSDDSSALVAEYFESLGKKLPADLDGSELNDPTLVELGLWLERWR